MCTPNATQRRCGRTGHIVGESRTDAVESRHRCGRFPAQKSATPRQMWASPGADAAVLGTEFLTPRCPQLLAPLHDMWRTTCDVTSGTRAAGSGELTGIAKGGEQLKKCREAHTLVLVLFLVLLCAGTGSRLCRDWRSCSFRALVLALILIGMQAHIKALETLISLASLQTTFVVLDLALKVLPSCGPRARRFRIDGL